MVKENHKRCVSLNVVTEWHYSLTLLKRLGQLYQQSQSNIFTAYLRRKDELALAGTSRWLMTKKAAKVAPLRRGEVFLY